MKTFQLSYLWATAAAANLGLKPLTHLLWKRQLHIHQKPHLAPVPVRFVWRTESQIWIQQISPDTFKQVRMKRRGWVENEVLRGGVAVSSTSERTHTSSLIMSSHLSVSGVELHTGSGLCGCVFGAPQQCGYLCRSGCVRADHRLLWTLCLFCFIAPPPCWIHFISCWHTAGSSVRVLQVAVRWTA